ncbi:MAG TPA: phosphoribosylformylglycinamidine synthase subunit PurL [Saprospiraceae bacterium]|nr:phosphoribosylformylglycinamidine synthase subunit PurL [Saprospiraceae bacterium]
MQSTEILPDLSTAKNLGLTENEFKKIREIMGRSPNFTELSIFSVMWSEHCSYKNSIKYLKTLPRDGDRLLVAAGEENAGLVDIGEGYACAFKIESHNHPSAIEPFQGAATGVGGIHRDIFTMGARPIASLNSLRFGNPDSEQMQRLIKGVVSGIGHYGNCFGVPTVGGEVYFNECYTQNILVNAMSVGIVKHGETISATSGKIGNLVLIVGSATGKDGIHGATFASADLTEDSAEDLPAVQVGDPFQEKLLLEATLEAIAAGVIDGMQDMGAAGITCSTSEMSAKAGLGMRIDLDKVPTRQKNMHAWEILLSESQERMLVVCEPGQEQILLDVYDKWDLECEIIGEVTDSKFIEFYHHGEKVAEVPADDLVLGGGAPVYDREYTTPAYLAKINAFNIEDISLPDDLVKTAWDLFESPNLISRRWIYEQYDSMVRTNTLTTNKASDAAISYVKGTNKALAMTTDCNSAYVFADPYKGAMIAVAEAARNIVCSGGEPVAITNCLNFGNPYNPEVYWQFVNVIKGMGEACRKFDTPVTGGNVSFYNQSVINDAIVPVYPTPTIGMLGILEDVEDQMTMYFKNNEDLIYLIGQTKVDLGSSEYLRYIHKVEFSPCPYFDIEEEFKLHEVIRKLIKQKTISSVHDISEGGLMGGLLESGYIMEKGFHIETEENTRQDIALFGESQSRIIVSCNTEQEYKLQETLLHSGFPFTRLGKVTAGEIKINQLAFGNITKWKNRYENTLENIIEHK